LQKRAYIDEAGNKDIDVPKGGASTFYVLGCLLIDADGAAAMEDAVEKVAKACFSGGRLKSSSIADNDDRRLRVLQAIAAVPGQFYALAIDKRRLDRNSGLRFPRSFYKWVLSNAGGELLRSFDDLDLVVDDHGSEEFREGVRDYMRRRYSGELFARSRVTFTPSGKSRGVQVADVVAGTVLKSLERVDPRLLDPIGEKLIFTGAWPRGAFPYHLDRDVPDAEKRPDRRIVDLVLRRARVFIEAHASRKDDEARAQVLVVQHLLDRYLAEPASYVQGAAIRRLVRMQVLGVADKSRSFMTRVIAPTRDAGVPIAGSPKGYKLPTCMAEVLGHFDQTCNKVRPMISRMHRFRDDVRLATGGEVDLYRRPEFEFLQRLVAGTPDRAMPRSVDRDQGAFL